MLPTSPALNLHCTSILAKLILQLLTLQLSSPMGKESMLLSLLLNLLLTPEHLLISSFPLSLLTTLEKSTQLA